MLSGKFVSFYIYRRRKSAAGWSLLELLCVLALIAIAGKIWAPAWKQALDKLALQQRKHLSELEHHGHKSAPQRIGCYLLALCPKNHDGEMDVELPYGKTVIAGKLNMKPETFSRSLKALEQDLGIKTAGRVIHIPEVNKLVSYCCSLCSYNYPCDGLR